MSQPGIHRPRNLDWRRAASLLYGDWGTSKAYVIGLAFVAADYSSLPIILAVCLLTAVVGCLLPVWRAVRMPIADALRHA